MLGMSFETLACFNRRGIASDVADQAILLRVQDKSLMQAPRQLTPGFQTVY